MIVEFNDRECTSIKSFAIKKRSTINVTTYSMSGKSLMFTKLSLKSFIYESNQIMCFPDEVFLNIYKKYDIEKDEVFHILTNTDSTALKLIFICDRNNNLEV